MSGPYESLADHLDLLASPSRLEILHALRTPKVVSEIDVSRSVTREGERRERPLSRQAVSQHLDKLEEAGLVRRVASKEKTTGDAYILAHERVFALVDEVRNLAKLRPILSQSPVVDETQEGGVPAAADQLPDPPRLMVAYGRDDGVAYGLHGGDRWVVGRGPDCDVQLDYDPYLSTEHCAVERRGGGFVVEDMDSSNGTWVNWEQLDPGEPWALTPGDLVTAGRSILVFQR